jgi:ribosomal-protein-alanine N-acetyltransferase
MKFDPAQVKSTNPRILRRCHQPWPGLARTGQDCLGTGRQFCYSSPENLVARPPGRTWKEAIMSTHEKQKVGVHIRWMIRRDMPEVLGIESKSFEFPWSEDDFVNCLRQRNCIGMVAEHDERVVGFMIYELHKSRLHIINFAVIRAYRRRGVGSQMLQKLIGKLSHQRRNKILLEVRETNLQAQLFFKNNQFRAVSVLRDFYDDTPEDAYLMQFVHQTAVSGYVPVNRITRLAG